MAEEYYSLPESPVYNATAIRKIQDNDPVRASTIVNPVVERLIENTHAVKLQADKNAAAIAVVEEYSDAKIYSVGDYCRHEGKLYRCAVDITTPETWNAAHWAETTVGDELKSARETAEAARKAITDLTKTIDTIPSQNGTLTFTGTEQTPIWNNYNPAVMTISGDMTGTDAGDYTAIIALNEGYKWADGTTDPKQVTWTINKAPGSLSISSGGLKLTKDFPDGAITVMRAGDGAITAASSNTDVATVSVFGDKVLVTGVATGSAVITVSVAEGTNHLAVEDKTFTVNAVFWGYLYGYDINNADQNPATRVSYPSDVDNAGFTPAKMNFDTDTFSYGDWPSTPGEKFMPRPCMLLFSGVVDHYLDPNDYTKKVDGTASSVADMSLDVNAMMEWPKIYTKRWEENGVYHFRCADVKVDNDYECWCNYDKNNNEIPHFYTPAFDGSWDSSGRMRSISGQACKVSTNAEQEVAAAKLNGADIWYTEVSADIFLVQDLLTMMFETTDHQGAAGYGRCSAANAIASGTMNDKGMFWGANDKISGVKVFGMENYWGNIWRRAAGWMLVNGVHKLKLTRGTKDGTDVSEYNFDGTGYLNTDAKLTTSGYISGMKTEKYGRLPIATSGGSTIYEADMAWCDSENGYATVCGCFTGNMEVGPYYVTMYQPSLFADSKLGAALSCKPLAETGTGEVKGV